MPRPTPALNDTALKALNDTALKALNDTTLKAARDTAIRPQMFEIAFDVDADLKVTPVQFGGSTLHSRGVFLVDTGKRLFFWVGRHAPNSLSMPGQAEVAKYLRGANRTTEEAIGIFEGTEVKEFELLFEAR